MNPKHNEHFRTLTPWAFDMRPLYNTAYKPQIPTARNSVTRNRQLLATHGDGRLWP